MFMLAVTTLVFADSPGLLLISFFFFYCTYALAAGVSGDPVARDGGQSDFA